MGVTFIDIESGNTFNGDQPYVFWFEDGQSTNLNYVKRICFYSENQTETISFPENSIFSILDMNQSDIPVHERIDINDKKYIDLEDLKVKTLDHEGWWYEDLDIYIHMIYIHVSSPDAGSYIDEFTMGDDKYSIGADFYNSNEILKSNLENLEITIPESIQRALYDVNVREESNDSITLNRKYKELLMNYWDIVANKGSYESLINSLKWFGWGDLVRIEEAWKVNEYGRDIYKLKPLNQVIDNLFNAQLSSLVKTTYIGLYCALYKMNGYQDKHGYQFNSSNQDLVTSVYNEDDVLVYNEQIPQLEYISTRWCTEDLCIKMALLGSFYQTYFMPIHLDLIHSTIEAWVFTNAIKLHTPVNRFRSDIVNLINTFELTYEYE